MLALAALAVALQGAAQGTQFDTTFAAGRGDRLEASIFAGSITVKGWDRDQVRIQATGIRPGEPSRAHRREGLEITRGGGTIRVQKHPGRGDGHADVTIWVPAPMAIELSGVETTISVEATQGSVRATTIEGDLSVAGGTEYIELSSVDGSIRATGVRGRLQVNAVDGGVTVRDARGAVTVNAVDGSIDLENVDGSNVQASTVDGDVSFRGPIRAGGTYRLVSHDGDVSATISGDVNAEVSISTFDGTFETDIPVTLSGTARAGRQFGFTLGRGGAQLSLETFDGTIRLARTGR
jgi:hypothetical protein